MSSQPLWLRDLLAYSIQAAALVGVGVVMARLLRLRVPRVRHAYWQALLAACVFLPLLQPWRPEALESSGATLSNITFVTPAVVAAPSGPSLAEIVLGLICAGIVLRILWMALGLGRLWLYQRRAERMEHTLEAVEEAQSLAPVSPSFFISRQLPTPATFGFFRPAILFPSRFLAMEPAMQKAIALHELLHVERRDWLWNMFEEIVLTLLWFHLPLWWVVRSARLSREQVVDAEAIRRSNARRPYLKALLEMAGQKQLAESLPAPLFLRENQLADRVALMMKEVHMTRTRLTVSMMAVAVTLLIAGATLVWAFPLKTSSIQAETPADTSAPGPAEAGTASGAAPPENAMDAESEKDSKIGKVYKVGGKVNAPTPIYKPEPPYTPEALKAHLSGIAVFMAVIDAKGKVVTVRESSKPLGRGLDESALKTIRNWRFNPGMRDGVAVPVKVRIEVSFRGDWNKKQDQISQNLGRANDPPARSKKSTSAGANKNHKTYVNQAELQRHVDEALRQAKIAQDAASKIDQKKIQEQIDQAMQQAKIAQKNFAKIDQAKIQQQVDEAMKHLQKMNMPEMRLKMQEQMKQLEKMNTPEMRRQMDEARKQLQKMNTPEMRQQLKQAMEQARIAQESAAKIDKAEIQRQLEQARKEAHTGQKAILNVTRPEFQRQIELLRRQAEIARQQAEEARQLREQMKKERLQLQRQQIEVQPLPPVPHQPASPSPDEVEPPAPPPASPQPPPASPSADKLSPPPASLPAPPTPPSPPLN